MWDSSRFLQEAPNAVAMDGPESGCYCPIGTVDVARAFVPEAFLVRLEKGVGFLLLGASFGVCQVPCSEEMTFTTTVDIEFFAFLWVKDNITDVQGFGNEFAIEYNNRVVGFCDDYFRNSIVLDYIPTTLRRSTSGRRHGRDRELQKGCFNHVAQFTVTGKCRGCQALGSPIPLFAGTNVTRERELDVLELDFEGTDRLEMSGPSQSQRRPSLSVKDNKHVNRRLATLTCICDAGAFAQKTAPRSLEGVQA